MQEAGSEGDEMEGQNHAANQIGPLPSPHPTQARKKLRQQSSMRKREELQQGYNENVVVLQ